MDFDEMNSFLSTHEMGNQDVKFKIRKRVLESRERRILGTLSGAYGLDIFIFFMSSLGLFTDNSTSHTAIIALTAFSLVMVAALAYAIFRMWRNPPPSPISLSVPGLFLAVCGLPTLSIFFFVNAVALIAIYYLNKTWKQLATLSVKPPEIIS
jgi:hypothetical protein